MLFGIQKWIGAGCLMYLDANPFIVKFVARFRIQ
jgi:hypothetical protein